MLFTTNTRSILITLDFKKSPPKIILPLAVIKVKRIVLAEIICFNNYLRNTKNCHLSFVSFYNSCYPRFIIFIISFNSFVSCVTTMYGFPLSES